MSLRLRMRGGIAASLIGWLLSSSAFAGAGRLGVHDGEGDFCLADEPEMIILQLSSAEAITSLREWLHHKPQSLKVTRKHSKSDYNQTPEELAEFLTIAFGGHISFCGQAERAAYFAALVEELQGELADHRAYLLVMIHARSQALTEALRQGIASNPKSTALVRAQKLQIMQREQPAAYPTLNVVKRRLADIKAQPD